MREGFEEIVSGWMLTSDPAERTRQVGTAIAWAEEHGPLQPDEDAVMKRMIEGQMAGNETKLVQRGRRLGVFSRLALGFARRLLK